MATELFRESVLDRPALPLAEAVELAARWFDVRGRPECLASERDQNVLLRGEDSAWVLKIANRSADPAELACQNAAMRHVRRCNERPLCPLPRTSVDGEELVAVSVAGGSRHLLRVVEYLPGVPLSTLPHRGPELLRSWGGLLGDVTGALASFQDPAAERPFRWDLARAPEVLAACDEELDDADRARVGHVLERYDREVAPRLARLPRAVIHGDANLDNVLAEPQRTVGRRCCGLIDFGDLVATHRVNELAIAAAYAMFGQRDPIAAACELVAGYAAQSELSDDELSVLLPLARMRLAVSLAIASRQTRQAADDPYLSVSREGARSVLDRLAASSEALGHYRLRAACGRESCPAAPAVRGWLAASAEALASVVPDALWVGSPDSRTVSGKGAIVFDVSVGSTQFRHDEMVATDARRWTEELFTRMRAAGVRLGLGRYDEPRVCYAGDQFDADGAAWDARRTIHIGVDVFAEAGTAVRAVAAGEVHSFQDNVLPFDYGPTVILRHEPEPGLVFYSLYGHLSRRSLDEQFVGRQFEAGEVLGWMGEVAENGGWPPHVHFQWIVDLLGKTGDFPGVAPPGERDMWTSLCPDPSESFGMPPGELRCPRPDEPQLRERRARVLSPSLSLSYRRPLHIVRGAGTYLYDAEGRAYVDGVNNVCHVGHCHPRVVDAIARQAATLNTNTRYLHEQVLAYAERLLATFPEPLEVCFFVNSGSEANDLALRLAESATGRRQRLVIDAAYHGNLTSLIDISPYKFNGPGGRGVGDEVEVVPLPDTYRGVFRGEQPAAGLRYAEAVALTVDRLIAAGRPPGAWVAESLLGCGGQIVLAPGYLPRVYEAVRRAGGVCIADEVQVGFGRVGSHFWGFETQGVIPDIVTLGKPIGNGHPIGAVITTRAIAERFANGMEYFNTYGGNPVSAAAGLAVLDVLEEERLPQRAASVGGRLRAGLEGLAARFPRIGEVRGAGLFLGVELVTDPESRLPDAGVADYLVQRLRDEGLLLSTDGPDHNVLKIKPPLAFGDAEADRLVATLERVLAEL